MELNDELALHQNHWWGAYLDALLEQQSAEVALALCAARRAHALAQLRASGWSTSQIADAAGLSRERVWQLITRDRDGRVGWVVSAPDDEIDSDDES
jgi:DNA-directed RNA polymerase specialized sigma24 family protein